MSMMIIMNVEGKKWEGYDNDEKCKWSRILFHEKFVVLIN